MWSLTAQNGAAELVFGTHRVRLADIAKAEGAGLSDRYSDGIVLFAMVFVVAGGALAFGVAEYGMRERFLLGTCFLGLLAYMGFSELPKLNEQKFFEVRLTLKTGETLNFACTDQDEARAFLAATGAYQV